MTKLKTKKAASKRFSSLQGFGFKRAQANRTHKLRKRTTSQKRPLRNQLQVVKANEPALRRLLPYIR